MKFYKRKKNEICAVKGLPSSAYFNYLLMFAPSYGMRRFVQQSEDGTPDLHEEETIHFTLSGVRVAFNTETLVSEESEGKLFITSKRVIFIGIPRRYIYYFKEFM